MKKLTVKLVWAIALLVFVMSEQVLAALDDEILSKGLEELKSKLSLMYAERGIKNDNDLFNYIKTTNPSIERAQYIVIDRSFYTIWFDSETKQRMLGTPFVLYLFKKREKGQITNVHVILDKERIYGSVIDYPKKYKKFTDNILAIAQQHNIRVYEVKLHQITQLSLKKRIVRESQGLTEQQAKENDFTVDIKRLSYGDLVELENRMLFRHTADTLTDSYIEIFDKIFEWIENEEQIYKKIEEAKKNNKKEVKP